MAVGARSDAPAPPLAVAVPEGSALAALAAPERDPYQQVTTMLAQLSVLLVGLDYGLRAAVSASVPLALILTPVWARTLRRYALATLIVGLMLACTVSGRILASTSALDHVLNGHLRSEMLGLLLSGLAAFALILWARCVLPLHRVVALYGLGGVVGALLDGRLDWKYGLALPTAFLVLGLLEGSGSRIRPIVAVIVMGIIGVGDDYRSYFAFCLLAATLTAWQLRPADDERAANRWWPALLIVGLATAMYLLSSSLLASGYLGAEVQERTTQQIEQSGSLIAGGRPEWSATFQLMKLRPSGYGVGVIPNLEDVHTAKAGLESIHVGLNQGRDRYMFGSEFRLHSLIADLWVRFGVIGVALGFTILVAVIRSLSFSLAARTATTSVILAALLAIWSLFFEPSTTYWVKTCVAAGLVLVARDGPLRAVGWRGYHSEAGGVAGEPGGPWRAGR